MRKFLVLALLGTSGCSIFPVKWEGIWFLKVPPADPSTCDLKGDENFDNGSFPEGGTVIDTNWTFTDEENESDSAVMVEILKGHKGNLFLFLGDRVFPATSTAKSLTAIWQGTTDDSQKEKHDAGYDYSEDVHAESTETVTLTRGAGGVFDGTWSLSSSYEQDYSETDQWRATQVGLSTGQIPSFAYLTGKATINTANKQECGNDCTLSLTTTCDGSMDISAEYAGHYTDGEFDGVKGATQPSGAQAQQSVPGTTGGTTFPTDPYTYTSYSTY